ncbi:MAG TPA: threonine--tRNA ligase [Acetomicrobium flavidum]|uniref:threonine--tRNA ligase n=1 Tax=Acetomicrobium flavidum TaxID=49896 RepID=UPI002C415308|nr:threonine--tRNA ligase [Acetomicrobium flavidum]HOM30779.1 threonine--tRNA ligase [Acetomicrobium flavidum]HOP87028.1 threonine--tRNA ligase [Acetomicrobium flavidum]HPP14869.1 threonine--tRNA ligase [Acetomicrobium flavidum]HPU68067.1 threonine--tRNA ligase [Acetomicrobium flavidum]
MPNSEHRKKASEVLKERGIDGDVIAVKIDGKMYDLDALVEEDATIEPVRVDSPEGIEILRHSASHIMAQAVYRLYPGTKYGVGPAIENGFYYDMDVPVAITEEDLPKIEDEMKRIASEAIPFERLVMSKEEAMRLFQERGDVYKLEILKDIEDDTVSLYRVGEFIDLCRGPHVPNTSYVKHFKLLSLAGAYWRGDERNPMLTRIYGTAFPSEEDLLAYLTKIEEAKRRDHRRIGKELDLFSLQNEAPGFPFFHPKGVVILNTLVDFWRKVHIQRGYQEIKTPLILDQDLWIRSGHWDHYRENMYFTEIDEKPFAIKPMNCPGGILVYKTQLRSYRDLPLKLAELGVVHRHERSGVLHGLMRVRCFTQDDAHIFTSEEHIKEEITDIMEMVQYIYGVFGFPYHIELSTRPENAMGDKVLWDKAEQALQEALEDRGVEYKLNPGDGAFYGPKIDFHLEDCIGRTWQCGTIQLDFQMPEKFDITYIGPDGEPHRPVMIHRTILGSLERFLGILIEQYAGAFPYWLAPVQVKILPVSDEHLPYAKKVASALQKKDVRIEVDLKEGTLGKKIRDAQMQKIPYMLIIGNREVEKGVVSVRDRSKGDLGSMSLEALVELLGNEYHPLKDDF